MVQKRPSAKTAAAASSGTAAASPPAHEPSTAGASPQPPSPAQQPEPASSMDEEQCVKRSVSEELVLSKTPVPQSQDNKGKMSSKGLGNSNHISSTGSGEQSCSSDDSKPEACIDVARLDIGVSKQGRIGGLKFKLMCGFERPLFSGRLCRFFVRLMPIYVDTVALPR
ncbi:hypothetical protein cyc_05111 [Cyclospora cayetanensis]|uniref:Uncharacterized protein n=1 Tax=Cyclospora cayetanensis TaxID=88456 RepID=A0A1D3D7Z1_9EIME|nr:hypothetical protein cyc_05111 [Cyclospora cayetanensis]